MAGGAIRYIDATQKSASSQQFVHRRGYLTRINVKDREPAQGHNL